MRLYPLPRAVVRILGIVAAVLAFLLLLASCGLPDHGVVVGKHYEPARSWQSYDCQTTTISGGNGGIRTAQTGGWVQRFDPECYLLKVRADGPEGDVGAECVEGQTWEAIQVGDRWDRPRG